MTAIPPDRTEGEAGHIDDHHAVNAVLTEHAADIATRALDADLVSGLAAKLATPGAWTAWTPGASAGAGAITSYTSSGRYCVAGKLVFVAGKVTITNNGTGSSHVIISNLPYTIANQATNYLGGGREGGVTGKTFTVEAQINTTTLFAFFYDNSYPGGTNHALRFSIVYEMV